MWHGRIVSFEVFYSLSLVQLAVGCFDVIVRGLWSYSDVSTLRCVVTFTCLVTQGSLYRPGITPFYCLTVAQCGVVYTESSVFGAGFVITVHSPVVFGVPLLEDA